MKILKYILILVLAVGVLIFLYLGYSGIFSKTIVSERELGPYQMICTDYYGSYRHLPAIQDSLHKTLKQKGLSSFKKFNILYDNPLTTDKIEDEYHSISGCILEESEYLKISSLFRDFDIKKMSLTRSMVAQFPYRTKLSMTLSASKAYQALHNYAKAHNYQSLPILEIYDKQDNMIFYSMEIREIQ